MKITIVRIMERMITIKEVMIFTQPQILKNERKQGLKRIHFSHKILYGYFGDLI